MMSSPSSKRPLKELLEEQQEPFELEEYLLERGYSIKGLKLHGGSSSFGCCSMTSTTTNFLKKSATIVTLRKRKKDIARASHRLLASLNQTIGSNDPGTGSEGSTYAAKPRIGNKEEEEESGRFSRGSSATEFESCTEGDVETTSITTTTAFRQDNSHMNESFPENVSRWRITGESKQTSPVSVLDEIEALSEYHPICNERQIPASQQPAPPTRPNKVTEDSTLSASLWDQLLRQRKKTQGGSSTNASIGSTLCPPQYINSKKALQQTRQLLFDCVREVVETNGRKQTRHQLEGPKFLGPEELGKIIYDNIKAWGKQSVNESKVTRLLNSELIGKVEWSTDDDSESYRREVMIETGDKILEDVKDDIIEDMITMLCSALK